MKKVLILLSVLLLIGSTAFGQNLAGALSGNFGPGSFNVTDSIWVASGATLTLAPGTTLNFTGALGFGIAGTLTAVGTAADSIKFQPAMGVPFWKGMDFTATSTTASHLSYCVVTMTNTGGIYIDHGGPVIDHSSFTYNTSQEMGGAIYSMYGTGSISNCYFGFNTSINGGAVVIRYTPVNVTNCIFESNTSTYGGAMAYYFSTVCNLTNCIFFSNSANQGGAIRFSSSPVNVTNCTFTGNTAPDASAIFLINISTTLKNCIVYNNTGSTYGQIRRYSGSIFVTYCDVTDSLWAGTGNITSDPLLVSGPHGNYYLAQIAAGQALNSPCVNSGDPASSMVAGATRTDEVQDAGIVDMGWHYLIPTTGTLSVTLTPHNPPIQIPAGGGSFQYDITIQNSTAGAINCDFWIKALLPNGGQYLVLLRQNVGFPAGCLITRPNMNQNVPGGAGAGQYTYTAILGDYPNFIGSSDEFTFWKLSDDNAVKNINNWNLEGWEGEAGIPAEIPVDFAVCSAYPNPFNPTTTIEFTLPVSGNVELAVYDIAGRLVDTLSEGFYSAGVHEAVFDGSNLASGVYLYRLAFEGQTLSGKIVLMK